MTQKPKTSSRRAKAPGGVGDLSALFGAAAQALAANQATLNQADAENHNHGDNMVRTFNMIAQSMAGDRKAAPSTQLQHASEYVEKNASSGSAHVYAEGLAQAAKQLHGQQKVTPDNAMLLIQSLLGGGGQPTGQGAADLLGSLMGGQQSGSGGGLSDGLDLGDLLNAGMRFMNARQSGQDNLQAALSALMSAGPMAKGPHRQQSGQLVANALLQALGSATRQR